MAVVEVPNKLSHHAMLWAKVNEEIVLVLMSTPCKLLFNMEAKLLLKNIVVVGRTKTRSKGPFIRLLQEQLHPPPEVRLLHFSKDFHKVLYLMARSE